jgi:predicted ATP-dependent serine protease
MLLMCPAALPSFSGGAAGELGIFTMKKSGLEVVTNPGEMFVSRAGMAEGAAAAAGGVGSAIGVVQEGIRPLLLEVQASWCWRCLCCEGRRGWSRGKHV